jgi:hypothetical protein
VFFVDIIVIHRHGSKGDNNRTDPAHEWGRAKHMSTR